MVKSKIIKQIMYIIIIAFIMNIIVVTPVHAMGEIIKSGQNFLEKGQSIDEVIDQKALRDTSTYIYNMFLVVGIVLAVGVGTVLGIKFMTSSAEGQAKIKEALVPYIIAVVIMASAFTIWKFVVDAGQKATGQTSSQDSTEIHYAKKDEDTGKLYCWNCGDLLSTTELNRGRCSKCDKAIHIKE